MSKWCREIYLFPPVELSSIEAAAQCLRDMLITDGAEKDSMNIYATAGPNNTLRLVGCAKVDSSQRETVPVVHGRWEVVQVWKNNPQTTLKCSVCETNQPIYEHDEWQYCPFCGAKMDGGSEE